MLFLLASLAATGAPPIAVRTHDAGARSSRICAIPSVTLVKRGAPANGVRRLGEEPPATEYLAVDRTFGGCPTPAIVRTGIGR